MRQSQLFTKTRRDAPKDEVAKNAQLLTRAGFIHKEMAGVYSYLPLGLRTLNKIVQIIREEMNAVGGLLIVAIGLDLIGIKRLPVGNMLPAVFVTVGLVWLSGLA